MKNIAIIGTGISGLTAAYYLSPHHRVTLFEAEDYIGGHTHTVHISHQGEDAAIDTGFIVFNERTYPRFIRLMDKIGVAYQPTEMSFSVRNDSAGIEYSGTNLNGLFAQRKNIANPHFWRLLFDIFRFNRQVRTEKDQPTALTIGHYLDHQPFGHYFTDNYLLPMISAIWSMGLDDVRDFPLAFFTRFFENHGLLDIINRPQWYTIKGGSSSYIKPLTSRFNDRFRLNEPVKALARTPNGVEIISATAREQFDEVILACHADQALTILDNPLPTERRVLDSFRFTQNRVTMHTDTSLMPQQKKAWASWNYLHTKQGKKPTLTYNMNILQRLDTTHTYLVTLNQEIAAEHILFDCIYDHPAYSPAVIDAQKRWADISGVDGLHFCGAYWFNGFHEDGVRSGLRVCKSLGVTP